MADRSRTRDTDTLAGTMLVWNGIVSRLPALAISPATVLEVAAAVAFARDHGLRLLVRGQARPGPASRPSPDRALTLDLSKLDALELDVDAGLAHVGAGCPPGAVERAAAERGLSVDTLVEVELVTPQGLVLVAGGDRHAALSPVLGRGGHGPGIVTRTTFRLRPRRRC